MNRLDLYSRLRGSARVDRPESEDESKVQRLNARIGGDVVSRGSKSIICVFRKIPRDNRSFIDTSLLDVLFPEAGHPVPMKDLLFFDVETTGLSGGAGTVFFLIGFLNVGEDGLEFTQFFLNSLSSERLFLEHVEDKFAPYTYFVSYNGKSFDFNIIKNRFIMQGMRFGGERGTHLDLLYTSRRLWRGMLPDYSLSTVEEKILDVKRTGDIPGWRVPEVYSDFLRGRNIYDDMKAVFSHNRDDILSLFTLLEVQLRIMDQAGEKSTADELPGTLQYNPVSVSGLFSAREYRQKAVDILTSHQEDAASLKGLALLHKRDKRFEQALKYFKRLCEKKGSLSEYLFICTEISKIYEHHIKNYQQALLYTQRMIKRLKRAVYFYPRGRASFEGELENVNRRYARLLRKIGGSKRH